MAVVCSSCGAALGPGARFCSRCGTPVAARPEDAPASGPSTPSFADGGEERKLVTGLFADITGSTVLADHLDPERLRAVLRQYFDAMRAEIEAQGGTVEKFIGDAVMAAFGVPTSHEDDASRALRAADTMRRRLDSVNEVLVVSHGLTLQMRMGLNTGEVLAATSPEPGSAMVTGDVVNVAARLQTSAEPGEVLVSERTAHLGMVWDAARTRRLLAVAYGRSGRPDDAAAEVAAAARSLDALGVVNDRVLDAALAAL